jgi:ankyrin repeat protein
MKAIIEAADTAALEKLLHANPARANNVIHFGASAQHAVSPIHYVCDCVFEDKISEEEGMELVQTLVEHGARTTGSSGTSYDTPLIAAISLLCEDIAAWLLTQGANPHERGTHRGTALHWAAWTGGDRITPLLLEEKFDLEDREDEFGATPLIWAINGAHNMRLRGQVEVVEQLLAAGANPRMKDMEGNRPIDLIDAAQFPELKELLRKP